MSRVSVVGPLDRFMAGHLPPLRTILRVFPRKDEVSGYGGIESKDPKKYMLKVLKSSVS